MMKPSQQLGLLDGLSLSSGVHACRESGLSALEAVAWIAGLPHSDRPECTSEVLAYYVRYLNDKIADEHRNRLIPLIPRLVSTAIGYDLDLVWSRYLAWKAVCVFMPMALRARGFHIDALLLEAQTDLRQAYELTRSICGKIGSSKHPADKLLRDSIECGGRAALFGEHLPKSFDERSGAFSMGHPYGYSALVSAICISKAAALGSPLAWDHALVSLDEALTIGELACRASANKPPGHTFVSLSAVSSERPKEPEPYPYTSNYYFPVGPILELRLQIDRAPP